jgi:beta-glucosidase
MKKLLRVAGILLAAVVLAWLAAAGWLSLRNPRLAWSDEELARPLGPWPPGFLWGTATAAHQIEGGNTNDWTRFEAEKGAIENGDTSEVAADAWNRMATDDIAVMKALRANAYRFGIEWSRLEPQEGAWSDAAWERYQAFATALRAQGITPMVTLLHFTLPQWLADRGGVTAPDFPDRFARFAGEAARRLGPNVDLWITVNEPNVHMYMGYAVGQWPPRHKSAAKAGEALVGLARGHAAAAAALRAGDRGCQVGVANNLMWLEPKSRLMPGDWLGASMVDAFWNWTFQDAVHDGRLRMRLPDATLEAEVPGLRGSTDFFGLNYYFRYRVRLAPGSAEMVTMEPGPGPRSELGGKPPAGDSPPEALFQLLRAAWQRYGQPIYVTEGGIADEHGTMRGRLVRGQAYAIQRAQAEGVTVKGYLHWSLYDNFEWDKGYRPRFGLYALDRATLARTPRPGAEVFAALAP